MRELHSQSARTSIHDQFASDFWWGWSAATRGNDAALQAPPTLAAEAAASCFRRQWCLLLLVGVSAPAVPPINAPAPAPRPPPMIAPAAAPPPAPMPTFLARLRLPLLRLFLLERLRLLEVAAITGKAVSPSSPKHRTAAHSVLLIDRPSPDKICNQSAKVQTSLQPLWLPHLHSFPWVGHVPRRTVAELICTVLCHGDSQT
jgi:hypothetical protein